VASITETYFRHSPEKVAIHTLNERITYRTWLERVWKTANWLDSLKQTNQIVGILLPNGVPFLQLFTGAATAGWTSVLFDIKWTETEWHTRLTLSRPSIVITTRELFPKVKHLHPRVIIYEECHLEIDQTTCVRKVDIDGEQPFYMGFTSGTTGAPKAFIRSHDSWLASFDCTQIDFQLDEKDHVLIPGALIHSHFLYGVISTLYLGGTVYLLEKFSPNRTLSLIETHPITVVYLVPTMIAALLREERSIEKPVKFLSSGAKWEENSKQHLQKMFPHFSMCEFYGASELSFITVLTNVENAQKPGSVGKPCHNVEIQIRQDNFQSAKPMETGKIYVRSNMLFNGYLENNGLGIQSIEDKNGWMTVDDMGYFDEDGFLYLSGREANMILYGGINIFPEEIEKVVGTHPNVEEVAVIGISDPYWGQIATAVIKGTATAKELKRLCKVNLSSYKVPRKWIFLTEIPHTTSGKIARSQLKALIESKVKCH
jgi:long-chain acyl-CoA synthetase